MALPKLTATDEMKKIATSDLPRKEKTDYGYVREVCEYYTYLRCIKQDGILKVAFFFPEHLRLDGSNPAYEVYLDKEKRQFITYNSLIQKWCESKLDRLDWKRQYWYTKAYWISEEDETSIQTYLNIDKKAVDGIRLYHDLHEDGVIHVVLAFGKGHHPAVSTVAGIGVDGGTYGMAGAGTFGCGQAFCR